MKKGIFQTLKFLAFLFIGLLLLWIAFRNVDFKSLGNGLREAKYIWLILSIMFGVIAYLSRARRWVLLIRPMGYSPRFRYTFFAMMTGYLANLALPRIGEISKCVALGKKESIPVDKLIGTVVIERTIDFFSLVTIMVIMLFIDSNTLGPFLFDNIYKPLQDKLSSVFGFAWIFWIILSASGILILYIIYRLMEKLGKIRFFAKIFATLEGITHGLRSITVIENKWEFVFHTVFIWINYLLMTWVVVFTLESTSHLDIADGIFILVIGGLGMTAPVTSGIGAFHFIVSQGLLLVYNIRLEDGLVYAILAHESQLIFGALLGIFSFYALLRKSPLTRRDVISPL